MGEESHADATGHVPGGSGSDGRGPEPTSRPDDRPAQAAADADRTVVEAVAVTRGRRRRIEDLVGRAIHHGEFRMVDVVGAGGMGAVYRAHQASLGRDVAVKVISAELATDDAFVHRFQREARVMATISHPNIVQVIACGEEDGVHYIVMELVHGPDGRPQTVADVLRVERRIPPVQAVRIIEQACAALHVAHQKGIVHRDIKPGNLLLDPEGNVRIADFGIAADTERREQIELTVDQTTLGSLRYMSPEQRDDPTNITGQADIYSLGKVFYEMLVGRVPEGRHQPASELVDGVDDRFDGVIDLALMQNPELRFRTAGEMRDAVAELRESRAKIAPVAPAPGRSSGGRSWLVGALIIAAGVGLYWFLNRPTLQDRWFDAAAANRVAEVGDLLVSHPELLNASDERTDSRTALDLAMQHADRLLATRLVEAGADPNHRDPVTGKPPLVRIAELGVAGENDDHNIALVAALIRHGARVSDVDPASLESGSGVWSLITFDTFIVAVANDDRETVIDQIGREPHLVRATVSGSSISALHVAAYRGSTKLVDSLLDRGAEIDRATTGPVPAGYFDFVEREIPSGTTPLLAAVQAGHASTVGRLLARGADPSTIDESGFSPMRMAVRDGRVEIVDQLIRAAPDSVLESDAAGESTLVTAARLGHVEVVARLLDTDRFDDVQAQRAEDAARERGLDGTVSSIAAWRSATNARAFRRAVQDGDVDAVERLLEADPGLLNAEGTPPLRIAATHGHAAMVDVLLGRDGGWAAGEDGRGSPLTDALAAGHVEVVRRLVGSDQCDATYLKIRDTAGRSPLQLAAPDWETVSILVNSAACTEDVILQPVREDGSTILEMLCEKPSPTCAELLNLVIREKVAAGSLDGSLKRPLDVLARSGELPSVVDAAAASTMARTLLDADRHLLDQAPFESALRAGSEGVATVLLDAKPGLSVDPIADGSGRLYPVQLLDHAKTSSLRERLVVDSLRALFRDEPYDPALLDALKADLDTPFAMGDEATSSKVAALEHAVTRSTEPLVRALIDRDVSLECSASQGTLLHVALGATSVSESIVEAVGNALRGKAGLATALGKRDGQGRTPIELAVDTGAVTVVDLVLKWMDESNRRVAVADLKRRRNCTPAVTARLEEWRSDHPPTCTPDEVQRFRDAVRGTVYVAQTGGSEVEIQIDDDRPEITVLQGRTNYAFGAYRIEFDGASKTCRMTFIFSGDEGGKARQILPREIMAEDRVEAVVDLEGFHTGAPFVLITSTGELKFDMAPTR